MKALTALCPSWPGAMDSARDFSRESGLRYRVTRYPVERSWWIDADRPPFAWLVSPIREEEEVPC